MDNFASAFAASDVALGSGQATLGFAIVFILLVAIFGGRNKKQ